VRGLAGDVAAELGWELLPEGGEEGAMIGCGYLRYQILEKWDRPGHLAINGGDPCREHMLIPGQSISVRADRGPEVIAAEIRRRLMGSYADAARSYVAGAEDEARREQARVDLLTSLAAGFPHARIYGRSEETSTEVALGPTEHDGSWRVGVDWDASQVRFDLHNVPIETALRMLAILAEEG
jgi:hypothetical protein